MRTNKMFILGEITKIEITDKYLTMILKTFELVKVAGSDNKFEETTNFYTVKFSRPALRQNYMFDHILENKDKYVGYRAFVEGISGTKGVRGTGLTFLSNDRKGEGYENIHKG